MEKTKPEDLILLGSFMGIENLFPYTTTKDGYLGTHIYISEDASGDIDYVHAGINWYEPNKNWNQLIAICKKFDHLFEDSDGHKSYPYGYVELCNEMDSIICFYEIEPLFKHVLKCIKWYNEFLITDSLK